MTQNAAQLEPVRLRIGQRFVLPSGSVVTLVSRQGIEWECEYACSLISRGTLTLTRGFLLKRCKRV